MSVRTYGDKPISFQVEDGGEFYCIGSEVSEKFYIFKKINLQHFVVVVFPKIFTKIIKIREQIYKISYFLVGWLISPTMQRVIIQEIPGNAPKNAHERRKKEVNGDRYQQPSFRELRVVVESD